MILISITTKKNSMLTKNQDHVLVKGILSGSEKSLLAFYRHFSPKLLAFIKKRTPSCEDAEEILQDVLLSSLDSLRDFTFKSSLNTFLHAIAKNKIIDFYRKKKIKKVLFSQVPKLESLLTTLLGPEDVFEEKQLRIRISQALKKLSPKYQKIITLKYFDDLSVREITRELQISFKSAESMLFRARKAFAKALEVV